MLGELKRKQIGEGAFMNSVIEPKFKSDRISLCLVTQKIANVYILGLVACTIIGAIKPDKTSQKNSTLRL